MSPWGYIALGIGIAVLGGILLAVGSSGPVGATVTFVVAGIFTSIGVIAEGVRIGNRASD